MSTALDDEAARRFLVTGLPRIRSAWLAVLFSTLGVDTCHDFSTRFNTLAELKTWIRSPGLKGWCDPSAACLLADFSMVEFAGYPVVFIERDAADSRASLARWMGATATPRFDAVAVSANNFKEGIPALIVPYADLERYETVACIVRHCTGLRLPLETWRALDLLKIEQHVGKASSLFERKLKHPDEPER